MFRVIDAEHPPIRARGTGAHARKSWLVAKQADLKPVQRLQQLQLLQRPRRQLLQQQKQLQKQQLQQEQQLLLPEQQQPQQQTQTPLSAAMPAHLPWQPLQPEQPVPYIVQNKSVEVATRFSTLSDDNTGTYRLLWGSGDYEGELKGIVARANSYYPDPKTETPLGWRFKTLANSSLTFVYPSDLTTDTVRLTNIANAAAKLSPATALASTAAEQESVLEGDTAAVARARPGLQYGAVLAIAQQRLASTLQDEFTDTVLMTTRSVAEGGQGQSIALVRADASADAGVVTSDARADANAARWYMAPGHAVSGVTNIGRGGRAFTYTRSRTRSDLGSATGGVLAIGRGTGVQHCGPLAHDVPSAFIIHAFSIPQLCNNALLYQLKCGLCFFQYWVQTLLICR